MEALGLKICSQKADRCRIQVKFHITFNPSCFHRALTKSALFPTVSEAVRKLFLSLTHLPAFAFIELTSKKSLLAYECLRGFWLLCENQYYFSSADKDLFVYIISSYETWSFFCLLIQRDDLTLKEDKSVVFFFFFWLLQMACGILGFFFFNF